jgi:bifunctional enzyme CysN/CysC
VQLVVRPDATFRGYSGTLAGGRVRTGDVVRLLPSGQEARIASVLDAGEPCEEAAAPAPVTVCLEEERDLSRGDMIACPAEPPAVTGHFRATLIWMAQQPLRCGVPYLLKHTTRQVCATIERILYRTDIQTLERMPSQELRLNDIAEVEIETHHPLYLDPYDENRLTGSFIVIDMDSNLTVAAGMARENLQQEGAESTPPVPFHRGLTVWLTGLSAAGKTTIGTGLYERLAARGYRLEKLDGDIVRKHLSMGLGFSKEDRDENIRRIGFVAGLLTRNNVVVVVSAISPYRAGRDEVRQHIGSFLEVYVDAPLEVCEQRDPKGLYQRARAGAIPVFTGISAPYEPPERPDVVCHTDRETVEESVEKVFRAVERALREAV